MSVATRRQVRGGRMASVSTISTLAELAVLWLLSCLKRTHDHGATWVERWTGKRTLSADERTARVCAHGLEAEFNMLVKGAVMLAIGVFVVGAIFSSITIEETAPMYNASQEVENLSGQAFEIAPIVLIVIVAVLILAYVRGL